MDLTQHMQALGNRRPAARSSTRDPASGSGRVFSTVLLLGGSLACIGASMASSFQPLRPGLEIAGFTGFTVMAMGDLLGSRSRGLGRRALAAIWFLAGLALLAAAVVRALRHG